MAFITVSDAAGRVLFRRRATEAEVADAVRAAEDADAGAEAAMHEIATQRYEALAAGTTIVEEIAAPLELAEFEEFVPVQAGLEDKPFDEPELEETGLFHDDGMLDDTIDPWFGDARFRHEEEIAS